MLECNCEITPANTTLNFGELNAGEKDKVNATMLRQWIWSLRYLCKIIPDINFSVGLVRRLMRNPLRQYYIDVKIIVRYINGSLHYGLLFLFCKGLELISYFAVNWCGDKINRVITIENLFKFL